MASSLVWDSKKGCLSPFVVVEREIIASETNIRTVMQRRGLADQIKIQQLCQRFLSVTFQPTMTKLLPEFSREKYVNLTVPSMIALESRLRYETCIEQEFARLEDIFLKMKQEEHEVIRNRALYWNIDNTKRKQNHLVMISNAKLLKTQFYPSFILQKSSTTIKSAQNNEHPFVFLNIRSHMKNSSTITTRMMRSAGTNRRFRIQQDQVWNARRSENLRFLRHVLPAQEEAVHALQRIGRGSIDRSSLRVPFSRFAFLRAGLVLMKFLKRCVLMNSAKREATQRRMAKEWRRAASLSVDRGLLLRIFVNVLQRYAYYAVSTRLRAALHVVFRLEADQRIKRFYVTGHAVLRKLVRNTKRTTAIAARNNLELRNHSAAKIQGLIRRFLVKRRLQRNELKNRNALRAQCERSELENYSAGIIQCAFRGWIARTKATAKLRRVKEMRRKLREFNELRSYAATVIARNWRAHAHAAWAKEELERLRILRLEWLQQRMDRLDQPFDEAVYGGPHNPFCDRYGEVERIRIEMSKRASNVKIQKKVADFSSGGAGGKNKTFVKYTSRRDPVVPSAFAWLRGLPHAMPKFELTPEQEDQLREQKMQRRKNFAKYNERCQKNMSKLVADPLKMSRETREMLVRDMEVESTMKPVVVAFAEQDRSRPSEHLDVEDVEDDISEEEEKGSKKPKTRKIVTPPKSNLVRRASSISVVNNKENNQQQSGITNKHQNNNKSLQHQHQQQQVQKSKNNAASTFSFLENLKRQVQCQREQQQKFDPHALAEEDDDEEERSRNDGAPTSLNVSSIYDK